MEKQIVYDIADQTEDDLDTDKMISYYSGRVGAKVILLQRPALLRSCQPRIL